MRKQYHIAYACNEAYAQYVAVSIKSLIDSQPHNSNATWHLHILTDKLCKKARYHLEEAILSRGDFKLDVHEVNVLDFKDLPTFHFSIYAYLRFHLAKLLHYVDTVLYIDTDTLILDDLTPLFQQQLPTAIGIIPQISDKEKIERLNLNDNHEYGNSGVLLLNLEKWRTDDLSAKLIQWCEAHKEQLVLPDQDAINAVLENDATYLPLKYNVLGRNIDTSLLSYKSYKAEIFDAVFHPAIIHFAACAPWFKDEGQSPFAPLWHKTNQSLKHPAKITYRAKGWLRWKIRIKQWLFPSSCPTTPSIEVLRREYLQQNEQQTE